MAVKIKAYHLDHPENGVPAVAEFRGFWTENGRNVGLVLRFQGESGERALKYGEIAALQRSGKEETYA